MGFQFFLYIWSLFVSTAISVVVAIYLLIRSRNSKGAPYFLAMLASIIIWTFGTAMESVSIDLNTMIFWSKIQYFCYCYMPVFLFLLAVKFTGNESWLDKKNKSLLFVIPTIIILLVWTNDFHGLIRNHEVLDNSGIFPVIQKNYGLAFYILILYAYLLMIMAVVLFLHAAYREKIMKKQAGIILVGVGILIIFNISYSLGIGPIKSYDITPALVGPAGAFITLGIFRYRLFNLVPIARAAVIDATDNGILILDFENKVIDINHSFRNLAKISDKMYFSKNVEDVCVELPDLVMACLEESIVHTEFKLNCKNEVKIYEAIFSPLTDEKKIELGRLIVVYEITEKKKVEQEYISQQTKLATIIEREKLARDLHDNLGQVLSYISLQAQGISRELSNSGVYTVNDKLDKLVNASQAANQEIREYISNVRKTSETEYNFKLSLEKEIINFEKQTEIKVALDFQMTPNTENLPPSIKRHILNIIKESMNNVRKHANAKNMKFILQDMENELCISIEDDGDGYDLDALKKEDSFGIKIMRERTNEIGGSIEFISSIGNGSEIKLHVPLKEESDIG